MIVLGFAVIAPVVMNCTTYVLRYNSVQFIENLLKYRRNILLPSSVSSFDPTVTELQSSMTLLRLT